MKINNEALIEFLNDVYNDLHPTILSDNEIKDIEELFNNNYNKLTNLNDFYALDPVVTRNIKKVKSVRAEVERQFSIKKRLQSGTLCECVMAETIAKIYGLNTFADLFHTYIRELPANILYRLRDDNNKILCRYIYYNEEDLNTFLIQYGNPTRYDADLYIDNKIVKIEFKDKLARAGEKETEYDEHGKLVYSEQFAFDNPDYIPLIEMFNSEASILDLNGNYPITDNELKCAMLRAYFDNLGFEALVSIDKDSQLVVITRECIEFENVDNFLSLNGSEIRRAGKNSYGVFTPKLLIQAIIEDSGEIDNNKVSIPCENMKNRVNNGVITGKKINHLFFVKMDNIKEINGNYVFSIDDVRQLKPTLCVHMQITSDRNTLISFYNDVLK